MQRNVARCLFITRCPVTTGEKIRQRRLKLKKTRKQLASELGVSVKTLWGWETDRWQPPPQRKKQIAKIIECAGQ
jgi:transcriptional regulator with XRE-family HTH domain